MKKWGLAITGFYAIAVVGCLFVGLGAKHFSDIADARYWVIAWVAILTGGEALLLFLSADWSNRKLRPRRHLAVSVVTAAILTGLLMYAGIVALLAGVYGDNIPGMETYSWWPLALLGALWVGWGVTFYLYASGGHDITTRLVGWLLKGSILELLIAVPSHVVARRRNECCAPVITGWGLATGLAVMLLSFGPSVFFLYQRKMSLYKK